MPLSTITVTTVRVLEFFEVAKNNRDYVPDEGRVAVGVIDSA